MDNANQEVKLTTSGMLSAYRDALTKKLHPNMLYPSNKFGFEIRPLHYDEIVKTTRKDLTAKGASFINSYENGVAGKLVVPKIQEGNIGRFFSNYDWNAFVGDFLKLKKELLTTKLDEAEHISSVGQALECYKDGGMQFKEYPVKLFANPQFTDMGYTKADDDFLFNHLYKDNSDNYYYEIDGDLLHIRIKLGTETTILGNTLEGDDQLWPRFFNKWSNKFREWARMIKLEMETWKSDCGETPEERILKTQQVPRIFLEMLRISLHLRGFADEKGKMHWYYDSLEIVPDLPGNNANWSRQNLVKLFSERLMTCVDSTRVKRIPLFTNDENEQAIKYIHCPIAHGGQTEEPELPETWAKFLGAGRFYDPKMDKLKLAHFISNVLNANYSGRQVLVLGGAGHDGKGVFLDVLSDIIGNEFVATMTVNDFAQEDRFGLQKVFNKKLVSLGDCKSVSKLFSSDKFKSLTGGDAITLERKNQNQFNYKPKGLCVAIATNNSFYVADEHGRSRAMPCVFLKNFDRKSAIDKSTLTQLLIAEKQEFLQWCVDYKNWMQTQFPGIISKSGELIICTDEDLPHFQDMDEWSLFKNACEKQMLGNRKFCNWNAKTEDDEENEQEDIEIWKSFLINYFEYDPNAYCTVSEIMNCWSGFTSAPEKLYIRQAMKYFYPKGADFKAFKKWLATIGIEQKLTRNKGITGRFFIGLKPGKTDDGRSMRQLFRTGHFFKQEEKPMSSEEADARETDFFSQMEAQR